mmetsp:Transcript_26417/g.36342  ORF Transcript_26417/g.36342 Transcript_26417/m.36342 type:complete len:83 (+) Transcript_26417:1407-1655(+)
MWRAFPNSEYFRWTDENIKYSKRHDICWEPVCVDEDPMFISYDGSQIFLDPAACRLTRISQVLLHFARCWGMCRKMLDAAEA